MLESETVTSETSIDPKELKELIARLANPSSGTPNGSVKIKDIAETLDLKEDVVMRELARLRETKKEEQGAAQVEKLTQAVKELQTPNSVWLTSATRKAAAAIVLALLVGAVMFAFLLIESKPAMIAPEPPQLRAPAMQATTAPIETKAR